MRYWAIFDDSKQPFDTKLSSAIRSFVIKHGTQPKQCLVSLIDVAETATLDGVEILPRKGVQKNCFWLGPVEKENGYVSSE